MKCNKCKLEKERFDTYWHSTQGKFRTRKICSDCMKKGYREYKIKVKYGSLDEYYNNKPEYKKCNKCNTWKNLDEGFYKKRSTDYVLYNSCKDCHNKCNRDKTLVRLKEKGGSERVPPKPNTYADPYQKEFVFDFMKVMGWSFNTENGVWYKEGIKDKDNNWVNVIPTERVITKPKTHPAHQYADEIIALRNQGMKYSAIGKKYGASISTIQRIIDKDHLKNRKKKSEIYLYSEDIIKMRNDGKTLIGIATHFKSSKPTIRKILSLHNVW
jgi:hypothetical protein